MLRPFNTVPFVVNPNYDMGAHVSWCTCSGHRTFLWSQFFASFIWVPEIKLGQTRLCKYLCLLSHPARPQSNTHCLECVLLVQRKEPNEEKHEGIF